MYKKQYASVKRILWLILAANFLVAGIKIGIGITAGSHSVTADGIHSLADGSSNIVGLIGIWLAAKPVDGRHPYGHGKYEIIASLFIGVMLGIMAVRILIQGFELIRNPVDLTFGLLESVLMASTILINIFVAVTEYRKGKQYGSTILVTDSLHTRGDVMISGTVLVGLAAIRLGFPMWIAACCPFWWRRQCW